MGINKWPWDGSPHRDLGFEFVHQTLDRVIENGIREVDYRKSTDFCESAGLTEYTSRIAAVRVAKLAVELLNEKNQVTIMVKRKRMEELMRGFE